MLIIELFPDMYANKCFLRWHTFLLYVPRISLVYPDILQDGCNHNQKRQQRMSIVVKIIKCFLLDAHLYSIWPSCNNFGVSDSLKWIELIYFITIIFNFFQCVIAQGICGKFHSTMLTFSFLTEIWAFYFSILF